MPLELLLGEDRDATRRIPATARQLGRSCAPSVESSVHHVAHEQVVRILVTFRARRPRLTRRPVA